MPARWLIEKVGDLWGCMGGREAGEKVWGGCLPWPLKCQLRVSRWLFLARLKEQPAGASESNGRAGPSFSPGSGSSSAGKKVPSLLPGGLSTRSASEDVDQERPLDPWRAFLGRSESWPDLGLQLPIPVWPLKKMWVAELEMLSDQTDFSFEMLF